MGYDPKCYELALAFLDDFAPATSEHVKALAQEIQDCIEDFIEAEGLEERA